MYNSNITIRVCENDKEKFKRLTKKDNATMSEVIRRLIEIYINKRSEENGIFK